VEGVAGKQFAVRRLVAAFGNIAGTHEDFGEVITQMIQERYFQGHPEKIG